MEILIVTFISLIFYGTSLHNNVDRITKENAALIEEITVTEIK